MKHRTIFGRSGLIGLGVICFAGLTPWASAQIAGGNGFSVDLGGNLNTSSNTAGFDSSFDPESSNLTNEEAHTEVSDDTHSQLEGTSFSPMQNSFANASVETTPRTGVNANSQSVIGENSFGFGGHRNPSFSSGGLAGAAGGFAARQAALAALGLQSMQSSFTGGYSGRTVFSGQEASAQAGTYVGFSGEGVAVPQTPAGIGITQALTSTNKEDLGAAYYATDPVLSNQNGAYTVDLELMGDMPSPSSQTSQMFAETIPVDIHFQYDDGQTPPITVPAVPGPILGMAPEYLPAQGGFPDSTMGMAGQTPEAANSFSPLSGLRNTEISPFAPVSEGTLFGVRAGVHPNLHSQPRSYVDGSFEAFERRAQENRLIHGAGISMSSALYQQDLQQYREQTSGRPRRPTLQELDSKNQETGPKQLVQHPSVR